MYVTFIGSSPITARHQPASTVLRNNAERKVYHSNYVHVLRELYIDVNKYSSYQHHHLLHQITQLIHLIF